MMSWALFAGSGRRQVFAILFSQAVFDYISDEANPPLPPDVQDTDARVTGGHNGMSVFALRVQGCDHGYVYTFAVALVLPSPCYFCY